MTSIAKEEQRPARVDELDGLRGVLSLWVAVSHIFCWTGFWELTFPQPFALLWKEFIGGASAVDVFIILSGFAISFLLHARRQSYRQFMLGRFFRIYPVYGLCLLLGLLTVLVTPFVLHAAQWRESYYFRAVGPISASELAATGTHAFWHLTLLNGLIPKGFLTDSTATILVPAWSISLEWQYYLVAPLLARLVRCRAGLLLLIAAAWLGLHYSHWWRNPHLAFLPAQLPLFLIGIGSYHLYARFANFGHRPSTLMVISGGGLIAMAVLARWHATALILWTLGFGCIFVRGNSLISLALSALRGVLLHPWLQRLGRISYSLYLVHWPLIVALLAALLYCRPGISSSQAAVFMLGLGLPLILAAAGLVHACVERPSMAYGKRLTSPSSP